MAEIPQVDPVSAEVIRGAMETVAFEMATLDEYVSVEGARRDYGVALTGSLEDLSLVIDWDETRRLRGASS